MSYDAKIDEHLELASAAEAAGDEPLAKKHWKYAVFYDARQRGVDTKEHLASMEDPCCKST